jgi:hypothetical protein
VSPRRFDRASDPSALHVEYRETVRENGATLGAADDT